MECAHRGCTCQASMDRSGRSYCSEHCASQDAAPESTPQAGGCGCGHPGCRR
jgi:hypothetical protein